MPDGVDILLAAYNGGQFLSEQLRSLEQQTFRDWRLIARDDGSTDSTRALLAEFRARHPQSVRLVEDGDARLGPTGNFGRLLACSTADHVLFCDQDDVWLPDKIGRLRAVAREQERMGVPFLVHSDLEVVGENLGQLAPSLWRYQHIDPARCSWRQLLVQNVVSGCACLFNAALRRAALPVPPDALMHDWWVVLVAAVTGRVSWTSAPTVRYRQHGANDIGARRWGAGRFLTATGQLRSRKELVAGLRACERQSRALATHLRGRIDASIAIGLEEFGRMGDLSYIDRVRLVCRHRILKTGWVRNAVMLTHL